MSHSNSYTQRGISKDEYHFESKAEASIKGMDNTQDPVVLAQCIQEAKDVFFRSSKQAQPFLDSSVLGKRLAAKQK